QTQIDSNKGLLNDIDNYESNRTPDQESARLAQHLSKDDAIAKLKDKTHTWNALPDGTESVLDPVTGKVEEHPTYSIVNPNVKVKLSPETADVLALTNPQYKDLHATVGQDVSVPLGVALS